MAETETPFQQELGQEDLADPRESQAVHREHPSAKEYIRIGIILAVLTALEIAASYADVRRAILIPTLYALAFVTGRHHLGERRRSLDPGDDGRGVPAGVPQGSTPGA